MTNLLRHLLLLLLAVPGMLHAALTIEIIGSGANQIPIAIVPFATEYAMPQGISSVVTADLQRSGLFKMIDPTVIRPLPYELNEVNFYDWRATGAEAMVIGGIFSRPDGKLEVRFRLLDVARQLQLAGASYTITPEQLRLTAHKIADVIYEKLTGDAGVFSTKIAYIVKSGKRYELQVSDADGNGAQTVLTSNEPLISPAWSPDGTRLAYVSFERQKPIIYVQSLVTGQRKAVSEYRGNNSAPAWSPDGTYLKRLTHSPTIDTEPSFSPDGRHVIFTSDRGGSPQIYRVPVDGGSPTRLTFDGNYNVSPHYAPDGKSFAFIQRTNGNFNVAVQDLATGQVQVLTDTRKDESPSFAPNGKMILYATEIGGHGVLAAVSGDGRVKQRLTTKAGDVREPAWGPLFKNQ